MKLLYPVFLGVLFLFGGAAHAGTGYAALEFGQTRFTLEEKYIADDIESESIETVVLSGGYRFDSMFVTEIGLSAAGGLFNVFSDYQLTQLSLRGGYSIAITDWFHITPKVGVAFWEFTNTDGPVDDEYDGVALEGLVTASFKVSRRARLQATYSAADYEFGRAPSYRFGFGVEF